MATTFYQERPSDVAAMTDFKFKLEEIGLHLQIESELDYGLAAFSVFSL